MDKLDASLLSLLWDFLSAGLGDRFSFESLPGEVAIEIAWLITSALDVSRSSTDFFLERAKTEVCLFFIDVFFRFLACETFAQ